MSLFPERKLARCPGGQEFFAYNGDQYSSLYDLARGLEHMDEGAFAHHVNHERNDFHNWVKDVIGDATLAHGLQHLHTRESMMRRVVLRIRFLELMKDAETRAPVTKVKKKEPGKKSTAKKKTAKSTTKKPKKKTTTSKATKKTTKKTTKKRRR
ncbi:hypothetical protein GF342_03765 [Candidatus Woesearchaeota archaeon]|nr:hypothetical protein [Candidatus Woesearchaeota archaeon]